VANCVPYLTSAAKQAKDYKTDIQKAQFQNPLNNLKGLMQFDLSELSSEEVDHLAKISVKV
jgi:hypothetical protein